MLSDLLENPNKFIATILIGNNVVNISASALATVIAIRVWGPPGAGIATAFMTVTVIIFGEIIPKSLAARFADSLALRIAPLINGLTVVLGPVAALFDGLASLAARLVGGQADGEAQLTEQEIHTLIRLGQEEGVLDEYEHSLIRSVFDFSDTTAEEIMVPRIDVVAVPITTTIKELSTLFAENPFNRLPVYDGTLDNIVGAVHLKDYIRYADKPDMTVEELLRPVLFVPETLTIETIFRADEAPAHLHRHRAGRVRADGGHDHPFGHYRRDRRPLHGRARRGRRAFRGAGGRRHRGGRRLLD